MNLFIFVCINILLIYAKNDDQKQKNPKNSTKLLKNLKQQSQNSIKNIEKNKNIRLKKQPDETGTHGVPSLYEIFNVTESESQEFLTDYLFKALQACNPSQLTIDLNNLALNKIEQLIKNDKDKNMTLCDNLYLFAAYLFQKRSLDQCMSSKIKDFFGSRPQTKEEINFYNPGGGGAVVEAEEKQNEQSTDSTVQGDQNKTENAKEINQEQPPLNN